METQQDTQSWENRLRTAGHPPPGHRCTRSAPGEHAARMNSKGAVGLRTRAVKSSRF